MGSEATSYPILRDIKDNFQKVQNIFLKKPLPNPRKYLNFRRMILNMDISRLTLLIFYFLEAMMSDLLLEYCALSKLPNYQNSYIKAIIQRYFLGKKASCY
ncbi:MAG: hypothetical protein QG646_4275 [Euryarchaeota archaeon]|nr:hypothetical protein [Euryarchaeota archaeon]